MGGAGDWLEPPEEEDFPLVVQGEPPLLGAGWFGFVRLLKLPELSVFFCAELAAESNVPLGDGLWLGLLGFELLPEE